MKKELSGLTPGTPFEYGGICWVALDSVGDGVLCLAANTQCNRAFDRENRNDWTVSTLRTELNGAIADGLRDAGADLQRFTQFRASLSSNDGMKQYGSTIDGIFLLSCEQYRQYRHIIPQAAERWWTITPHSCAERYAAYVCTVLRDGSIDFEAACCDDWGVRPACVLDFDTLVDAVEDDARPPEPEKQKKAESIEELLQNAVMEAAGGRTATVHITIRAERV